MSLFKRKDSKFFWYKFEFSGKVLQGSLKTADLTQAKMLHAKIENDLWQQQKMGVQPVYTWVQAVARFITETDHKRSHKKDLQMLSTLHTHLGSLTLDGINLDVVDSIKQDLLKTRSKSTVNRYLGVITSVLSKAEKEWEWVGKTVHIRQFQEPEGVVRFLTHQEAKRLIASMPPHLKDVVLFALSTGLRHQNIVDLEWSKVFLLDKHMYVASSDSKNKSPLSIPLNQTALDVLNRQLGKHKTRVFICAGEPLKYANQDAFYTAVKRAGIEDFRFHDLRHTWASWHVQNGTSLQELQKLGGWKDFNCVLRYAHLSSKQLQNAACNLPDLHEITTFLDTESC